MRHSLAQLQPTRRPPSKRSSRPRPKRGAPPSLASKIASLVAYSNPPFSRKRFEWNKLTSRTDPRQAEALPRTPEIPLDGQDFTLMNDACGTVRSCSIHHPRWPAETTPPLGI